MKTEKNAPNSSHHSSPGSDNLSTPAGHGATGGAARGAPCPGFGARRGACDERIAWNGVYCTPCRRRWNVAQKRRRRQERLRGGDSGEGESG
jgi:hypothetical protein